MKQGYFTTYVEAVKRDVEQGALSKEEAVQMVLQKAIDLLGEIKHNVNEEQFMKDRMVEAQNIN
jgi:hypothetical protein